MNGYSANATAIGAKQSSATTPSAVLTFAYARHRGSCRQSRPTSRAATGRLRNATTLAYRWMVPSIEGPTAQLCFGKYTTAASPTHHSSIANAAMERTGTIPARSSASSVAAEPSANTTTATLNTCPVSSNAYWLMVRRMGSRSAEGPVRCSDPIIPTATTIAAMPARANDRGSAIGQFCHRRLGSLSGKRIPAFAFGPPGRRKARSRFCVWRHRSREAHSPPTPLDG